MKLKTFKPITNGIRQKISIQKNLLARCTRLNKSLLHGIKKNYGRSTFTGHVTSAHTGGGCKKLLRAINFQNTKTVSILIAVSYDPLRNAFIALNYNLRTKAFFNTLATISVYPGSLISCDENNLDLRLGYRTVLKNIPTGSIFHSLSLNRNKKIQYIRSAGTFGQLIQKNLKTCKIKLPSGKIIETPVESFGTLGIISNAEHNLITLGKAGTNRLCGRRPIVRGIAMNAVDHPHGGQTNGGRPSVTPWGIPTKGKPTVKKLKR